MSECIFCSVAAGSTPVDVVLENEDTIFFRDISPKAKVHILGIPKEHVVSVAEADSELVARLIATARAAAEAVGIKESGYRLVINTGSDSGWEVHHLHVHVLGGEPLGPLRS